MKTIALIAIGCLMSISCMSETKSSAAEKSDEQATTKVQYNTSGNRENINTAISSKKPTENNKKETMDKTWQGKTHYYIAMAYNQNVQGCTLSSIKDYMGYVLYEGKGEKDDRLKAIAAVKNKYPDADEHTATDFFSGQHIVMIGFDINNRRGAKPESTCKHRMYEVTFGLSLEDALKKWKQHYGASIIDTEILINKTF